MTKREQNGLLLAATARIFSKDGFWFVPSQKTAAKSYKVNPVKGTCTCPDHAGWGHKCKHIYAVEIVARRENGSSKFPDTNPFREGEEVNLVEKKKTYRQNWPAYNLAQTTEKHRFQALLFDLCRPLKTPPQRCGRQRVPMADVVFAAVFKAYSTLSSRRFVSDLADAKAKGYLRHAIHYNGVGRYLDWAPMTEILTDLVERSSLPLRAIETDFAVDSTGFSTSRFVRWFDEKYGITRSGHDWVKIHVMVGVKTNVITAVEIRHRDANDSPLFGPLLRTTAKNFAVKEISADKNYSSIQNTDLTFEFGATPYIAYKANSMPTRGGYWEKMLLYYQLHREDFLAHYHKRSNVESTFAMIKTKFRDHVRSRRDNTMKNEALCKLVAHNICCVIQSQCELGIEPVFWPKDDSPADPVTESGGTADGEVAPAGTL